MGRYFSGDINGKFWFAIQSSNDADNFGVTGTQPEELEYYFEKDNLPDINEGIDECIQGIGKYKKKIDKFFKENDSYNDKMLADYLKIEETEVKELLVLYARLELGIKIKDCVEEQDYCSFTAEC